LWFCLLLLLLGSCSAFPVSSQSQTQKEKKSITPKTEIIKFVCLALFYEYHKEIDLDGEALKYKRIFFSFLLLLLLYVLPWL
jgi:hypothetical protein